MANQNTKVNMKKVWEKYNQGDHITDRELDEAIEQTRQAVQYFADRGREWHLAWFPLVQDLSQLEGFKRSRDRNRNEPKPQS